MTATDPTEEQTARRPMSYAGAADTGPCEGRQASPSNPTGAGKARTKEPLTETFVFRCSAAEKAQLRAKAEAAGLPAATLLREALGLTEARGHKPVPRVDPALVLAVGRIGGNLNQIARWLNHAMKVGRTDLDTLTVARRLVVIERQLAVKLLQFSEAIEEVLVDYRPNILCNYLFETAQLFAKFFDQCSVKGAATQSLQTSRLQICDLTARTLKTGLSLLGIRVLDKM